MVMPSQAPRAGASRLSMSSRRRRGRGRARLLLAFGCIALLGGAAWLAFGRDDAQDAPPPPPPPGDSATVVNDSDQLGGTRDRYQPRTYTQDQGQTTDGGAAPPAPPAQGRDVADDGSQVTPPPPIPREKVRVTGGSDNSALQRGMQQLNRGELVAARKTLSPLLLEPDTSLTPRDAQVLRRELSLINEDLVFSPEITADDPLATTYTVARGDSLERIGKKVGLPYPVLARINRISNPKNLRAGANIKLIRGPFHVRVDKSDFRMDLFLQDPTGDLIYVRSLAVGLGEEDSTPLGTWLIREKTENPDWRNPRTGEYWPQDKKGIPIGEYWMALEGQDASNKAITGYGIHGTDEPDSIGQQASMGCIRLGEEDITMLFGMLTQDRSRVEIVP